MLKILGKAVPVSKVIALVVVVLIGIVSIVLVKNILNNTYKVTEETEHIEIIEKIHKDSTLLIRSMHHFIIEPDKMSSSEAITLISSLKRDVNSYRAMEVAEIYKEDLLGQIDLIDSMLFDLNGLEWVTELFNKFEQTGKYDKELLIGLEEFAYELEASLEKVNQIHFKKIKEWTEKSLVIAWFIIFLYIAFIIFGGFPFIWDMGFFHKDM